MEITEAITISIISALATSYFTYFFGFRQYLKERTREEIREDYIKNGIDKVIEIINKGSSLCDFNFAKAMRIIEYLEKSQMDKKIGDKVIKNVFTEMETIKIAPPPEAYKIQLVTGNHQILFSWIIETLADYSKYIDYLRNELLFEVDFYFRHHEKLEGKEKEFFTELKNRVLEIHKDISANESLKAHLLNLRIRMDEIGISSMKDFDKKVLKDKRIKEILKEVEVDYKKLKENEKDKSKKEIT